MIVCDMDPFYTIFNLNRLGYFRIPITCVRYFYVVKFADDDFRVKKFNFSHKMNVVSLNDKNAFCDEVGNQCKILMCVNKDFEIHHDSFVLGCKFNCSGLMLTSNFDLGDTCFFWYNGLYFF